ncbi:MAG TPA: SEC-C metal-binding domain-containing protein [Steroidobacteraceae bacterium]|nr:SEC-C metal-binding domain-containing protein [Steroidobacteraceae bacterium]
MSDTKPNANTQPTHEPTGRPAHESSPEHVHGPNCQHDHGHHHALTPFKREVPKVGRNDACPCGSGKKFKKCHGAQHE